MPAPYQVTTSGETTALSYSTQRKIEQLCDGSLLALVQTSVTTLKLVQITNPSGTSPTMTTLSQTFTFSGASNTVGDLFVLNNSTTTSDVWVAWSDNSSNTGLFVAHGTYTASGSSWSWDNTSTSISLGALTGGFMIPSIVWTGTNLIVATRCNSSNFSVGVTYTTTKNGSTGWATIYEVETEGSSSHYYPQLLHDATNGCTLLVYTIGGDTVYARVVADGSTPSLANLSAKVALSSTVNVGAANVSAVLDTANKRLHVVYDNTGVSTNPYYNSATYTTTSISAGTSFSVDSAASTFTGPTIGLDGASNPTAYIFWGSGAVGAASDIIYAKIASPYGSGNVTSTTNLTGNTANDNTYANLPRLAPMGSYVPLLYAHTVSAWAVEFDNSITLSSTVNGSCTLAGNATLAAPATLVDLGPEPQSAGNSALVDALPTAALAGNSVITGFSSITAHLAGNSVFVITGSVIVAPANATVTPPLAAQSALVSPVAALVGQGVLQKSATPPNFLVGSSALTITGAIIQSPVAATPPLVEQSAAVGSVVTLAAQSALTGVSIPAGTGIGGLAVTTKSQSWSLIGGSPGTEYDVAYTDALGAGWVFGLIPTYGGMPISSWYETDGSTVGINQTSLATSFPDGHLHWLTQSPGGNFAGSEDKAFGMTELAPTGTDYRRYYQCSFGPDSNGFYWTGWACIYPGDPGYVAYRFDMANTGASAIGLATSGSGGDATEIALLAGLQQADSTWNATNGKYGTLAGSSTTWPTASSSGNLVNADPDYVYILPAAGGSSQIGQLTVKQKPSTSYSPAWQNPQLAALVNSTRLKLKLQGDYGSTGNFPANTTSTVYLLNVLRRSLTDADARAIAADYITPGTPTTTIGSFTSFSYDEISYVYAASGNQVATTLDFSPAHVTTRFKPRFKITGWTAGSPQLFWGGAQLTANVDFRSTTDTTNQILYVQLYADVVASGAIAPQRNNATLLIQPQAVQGSCALVGNSGLTQTGLAALIATAGVDALPAQAGVLAPSQMVVTAGQATLVGASGIATVGAVGVAPTVALVDDTQLQLVNPEPLIGNAAIVANASIVAAIVSGSGNLIGNAAITPTASLTDPGPEAAVASSALAVSGEQLVTPAYGSVSLTATSSLAGAGATLNQLIGSSALNVTGAAGVGAAPAALAGNAALVETSAITFIATNDPLVVNSGLVVTGSVVLICGAGGQDALVAQSALTNAQGIAEGAGTLAAQSALATPNGAQVANAPTALPATSVLPPASTLVTVAAGGAALVGNNAAFVTSVLILGGAPDLLIANSAVVESAGAQIATPSSSSVALAETALVAEAAQLVVSGAQAALVAQSATAANAVIVVAAGGAALGAQSVVSAPAQLVTVSAALAGNSVIAAQASQGVNNVQLVASSVLAPSATLIQNPPGASLASTSSLSAAPEQVDAALVAVASNAALVVTGVILSAAPADAPLPAQSATTTPQGAQIAVTSGAASLASASSLVAFAVLIATTLTGAALVAANAATQASVTLVDPHTPLVGGSVATLTGPLTVQGVAQLAATAVVAQQSALLLASVASLPLAATAELVATPQGFAGLALSVGILSARTARAVLLARTGEAGLTARESRATLTSLP